MCWYHQQYTKNPTNILPPALTLQQISPAVSNGTNWLLFRWTMPPPSRPRGIILKFVRHGDCDELLRLAKVKRGFSASELDFSSENKVFVNPSLLKAFRELLYHAKCAAREGRVRFAWYSNGKVLVRKRDGQPAIHITSRQQLQDLQHGGTS
uniref:FP protein C-terminal domain-containing protein n=1 Tax=Cuerna arida TaxID=1464854 RepID=A0A1B6GX40_9HEMI